MEMSKVAYLYNFQVEALGMSRRPEKGNALPTRAEVAALIRERRMERGYSMDKLASIVGVSKTTVQNWEEGRVALKDRNRQRLAPVLGLAADELVALEDEDRPKAQLYVSYDSLRTFLEQSGTAHGVTPDEQDWLASQRLPGDQDPGERWWLTQLLVYRSYKPLEASAVEPSPKPRKPSTDPRKR